MRRMILQPLILLTMVAAVGCTSGGGDTNRPKTYPVTGTVTLDGAPVAGASVKFQLADGSRSALGTTDASGKYTLTTFEAGDGAVAGEYRVAVTKYEGEGGQAPSQDSDDYVDPGSAGAEAAPAGPKNLLPDKYADAMNSGLTFTVAESPENKFDIALSN